MLKNILIIFFVSAAVAVAQVKVVTTTTVIYDLVKNVGGDKVEVDYLSRGDQDVHFLEILPSYMLKLRKADLFFKVGLQLEMWAPQLIDGSRNSSLKIIDLSENIAPKEIPTRKVDASLGDVHPFGNPHYWLDPENAKSMLQRIYEELSSYSPENEPHFKENLQSYFAKLDKKIIEWEEKMSNLKQKEIVFFHSAWIYFTDRFGVTIAGYVEPKPGIPPTPSHNASIIKLIQKNKINLIVMDVFYSDSAPNQIASVTGAKVLRIPTQVYGLEKNSSYIDLIDYIVNQISSNG
ncbi:MAG: metal ABC transporter substrate-binding protein [Ignavibacteria bacterium]|nr:metal ABC transporter substrate-binding protein [Ignavibacteria bacterium]MBT8381373.1 metal ABC transporter substrate-binding protein [Ignavibacteria bacterium]MBT8390977.1 metal ABC transporter substrate-binding protein [Ignavibacteria bacterium]NNJ54385.1 zinc ABC transporter substrate-binding protein [Ignavibacteriaceae bacterium]NNL21697.1 zinc ABC transporter substrate-binding protein [Ignavibacteriaceae bacterium]